MFSIQGESSFVQLYYGETDLPPGETSLRALEIVQFTPERQRELGEHEFILVRVHGRGRDLYAPVALSPRFKRQAYQKEAFTADNGAMGPSGGGLETIDDERDTMALTVWDGGTLESFHRRDGGYQIFTRVSPNSSVYASANNCSFLELDEDTRCAYMNCSDESGLAAEWRFEQKMRRQVLDAATAAKLRGEAAGHVLHGQADMAGHGVVLEGDAVGVFADDRRRVDNVPNTVGSLDRQRDVKYLPQGKTSAVRVELEPPVRPVAHGKGLVAKTRHAQIAIAALELAAAGLGAFIAIRWAARSSQHRIKHLDQPSP